MLLPEPLLSLRCRALSLHLGPPETQALPKREGDREGRARIVQAPLPYPVFVTFRGSALQMREGRHRGHGYLSCRREGVSGSSSTAAPLPVSMDTSVVDGMELCVPSSLLLWVLCRSGLHCDGQRAVSTDTVSVVLSVPPLCDPIHLPVEVQLCGILRHPVVLGRGTSVGLWMF